MRPSSRPTRQPSTRPSRVPSTQPSREPYAVPSTQPTVQPTQLPSSPSGQPTAIPSHPTHAPTQAPSHTPLPTKNPTTTTPIISNFTSLLVPFSPTTSTSSTNGAVIGIIGGICGVFLVIVGAGGGFVFYQRLQIKKQGKGMKIHINDDESQQAEEGGFSPAKVLVLVTSLKYPVLAGATKLEVYSHANCKAGMLVTLSNPHYPNIDPEQRWIIAIGSLILDRPLDRDYGEGTVITVTKKADTDSVLDNNFASNHKFKPRSNLGVSGKSTLTMSAKSDLTISGKSDLSVSEKRNHRNRIYPIDDGFTMDSPISNNYNTSFNNRSSKEMEPIREAGRMRMQDEAEEEEEEEDEEHLYQLDEERKSREAAMQRRLQSASIKESKRRMPESQQEEEKQTVKRVFVEPREVSPSALPPLTKVHPNVRADHVDWDDLSVYTAKERMFLEPRGVSPPRATNQSSVVIDQSSITLPINRPMIAIDRRGISRRNNHSSRWEQDALSTEGHMLYEDESKANDEDDLSDVHSLTSSILSRRMSARQLSNRHLYPLRRAQSVHSSCRSYESSVPAAATVAPAAATVAPTVLPPLTTVPPNIGAGHVDWDDLSVYTIDDSPVRQVHIQSPSNHDNSRQGQGWATTSSRSRSFRERDMHPT